MSQWERFNTVHCISTWPCAESMCGVSWCSSLAELQKIACVLDCQCAHAAETSRRLGCICSHVPEAPFLDLRYCHPSTQRSCVRLLWNCKAAHAIGIGAFWTCSVVDNLGMTSEMKLFTGPCLCCCSSVLYPANCSNSRGQKVQHWPCQQFLKEGLKEMWLFWDLFLLYTNAD